MLTELYPHLSKYEIRENTGSMSSNRFSMQISFAMAKIFDLYKNSDFTISLDCIDDVVIFITSENKPNIITYQIKTKDSNAGDFQLNALINKEVFKKLYDHVEKIDDSVKEIYLVSNLAIKYKKKYLTGEGIILNTVDSDIKKMISDDMAKNASFAVKGFSDKFIFSQIDMSIHNHKEITKAKLNEFLINQNIDISIVVANALFNTLLDILETKQNYEFSIQDNILTVLPKKSYTRTEFNELLENVKSINKNFMSFKEIIEKYQIGKLKLSEESEYIRSIASFKEKINNSPQAIGIIMKKVVKVANQVIAKGIGSRDELLKDLEVYFKDEFNSILSKSEKKILFINSIELAIEGDM